MNAPELQPDIPRGEVARAGGGDMSRLADGDHKDEAMRAMATGLAVLVRRLHEEGKVDGIIGMVNVDQPQDTSEKPLVVASMFGNTTTAVGHAQGIIEAAGYEVLTFHTTGTGGKTMEDLIADGYITALLDITAQVESFKNMTLAK
jgi:uncharacterized protein (UPF0261 family)